MAFWMIAFWIAATILQFILQKALTPKVAKRGPGEIQAPMSEQGFPIPVAYGCVKLKGANVVGSWYEMASVHDSAREIYDYSAALHLALCHGPIDRFRRVWAGDMECKSKVLARRSNDNPVSNAASLENMPTQITYWPQAEPAAGAWFVAGSAPIPWFAPPDTAKGITYQSSLLETLPLPGYPYRETVKPGYFIRFRGNTRQVRDPGYHGDTTWEEYVTQTFPYPSDAWPNPTSLQANFPAYTYLSGRWWRFEVVVPQVNDTIMQGGVRKRWTGSAWVDDDFNLGHFVTFLMAGPQDYAALDQRFRGWAGMHHGEDDQAPDSWLFYRRFEQGVPVPYFGGICHMVVHGNPWGGYSPSTDKFGASFGSSSQILPLSVEIERCPNPLSLAPNFAAPSYTQNQSDMGDDIPLGSGRSSTNAYDANPANILFDLLTNTVYGLGVPVENIDYDSYYEAGQILGWESFGMSMLIDQHGQFDDVASDILKTIDGVQFCDPATGKFTLRLIREVFDADLADDLNLRSGYYTNDNPVAFDDDDIIGDPEYTRGSWGDVANEVRVQYINREEDYAQRVVFLSDPANRAAQGETVTVQNVYNGITNGDLALRLAYRDLRTVGYPRARLKIVLNRKAWSLRPGDVFVLSYPTLGIAAMAFRVGEIRYSDIIDGKVEIQAIEDVFSLPDTIYAEPDSGWVDPATVDPVAPSAVRIWEPPYPMMADAGTTRRGLSVLAVRGDEYTTGGELWGAVEGQPLTKIGNIVYTASAFLSENLGWTEREDGITIQGGVDIGNFLPNGTAKAGQNLALIGTELIAFDTIGTDGSGNKFLAGCLRGAMDTIPRPHSIGDRIWLVRVPLSMAQTDNPTSDRTEMARVVASNPKGTLDVYTQPIYSGSTNSRQIRPLVPGRFRVESDDLATTQDDRVIAGSLDVSWEKRNRLTQAPGVVAQDDPSVEPETNQASRLVMRGGMALVFDPWSFNQATQQNERVPFGVPYRMPGKGATPSTGFLNFPERTFYYIPSGLIQYDIIPAGTNPTVTTTEWMYASLNEGIVRRESTWPPELWANDPTRYALFRMDWVRSGADMLLTLTDLRSGTDSLELVNSPTATSHAVTPQEIVDLGTAGPVDLVLDSVRDGVSSWEQRESGLVFPAGWGMSWGLHWGGVASGPPQIGDTGDTIIFGRVYSWVVLPDGKMWLSQDFIAPEFGGRPWGDNPAYADRGLYYSRAQRDAISAALSDGWRVPSWASDWYPLLYMIGYDTQSSLRLRDPRYYGSTNPLGLNLNFRSSYWADAWIAFRYADPDSPLAQTNLEAQLTYHCSDAVGGSGDLNSYVSIPYIHHSNGPAYDTGYAIPLRLVRDI